MTKPTGYTLWTGPSRIDRSPIAVIATLESDNRKTGNMVQTWILRTDIEPHTAVQTGADRAVCGSCAHRPAIARLTGETPCYVVTRQGPLSIYRAFHRGAYTQDKHAARQVIAGRALRMGAYGDPAAAPPKLWLDLAAQASGHTGYTQRWRLPENQEMRHILMASVHTQAELTEARLMGWRTFRIVRSKGERSRGEFWCPASPEGGDHLQCIDCLACNGMPAGAAPSKASVAILEHGSPALMKSAARIRQQLSKETV